MKMIIYKEVEGGRLERHTAVDVPDTSPTPEQAAWTTFTRAGSQPLGDYSVMRAGQRFQIVETKTRTAKAVGPIS